MDGVTVSLRSAVVVFWVCLIAAATLAAEKHRTRIEIDAGLSLEGLEIVESHASCAGEDLHHYERG